MSKKILLSIAAVTVLAMTAFAGDWKYEDWPTATYTKTVTDTKEVPFIIETIPVEIHIPYYVILWPQPLKIELKQVGTSPDSGDDRFFFRGIAIGRDGDNKKVKPTVHANYNATLSTKLTKTSDGDALDTKNSNWQSGVDASADQGNPRNIDPNPWPKSATLDIVATTPVILDIWCSVDKLNLLAFHQCNTLHVADVDLLIMKR
jgi:hypothetical protein